ncbi:choline ABC transporter permease [Halalkalibacillus sediminis]|uniref:Choline ABC transporter permease n=1 Tax=Halalkalibacillus sediminis TaxID=2018042 RepID=A0A2I0QTL7_9BACI|nr:ABC transporter permease [Halalkalibacillus sediminis]PKR77648.1 choline ABC transporter permease [Halalkalibacillus sediminis]
MEILTDYIEFLTERYESILEYSYQHLTISFLAIIFGILLTVPLAVFMTRIKQDFIKGTIFNIANIFQTIPTIALLALMIPLFGIGMKPAVIALFLYSLLPLLRNTYAGIASVDPGVIESAKGMGFSPVKRLFKIELPLAMPYIMSGIRTTTVYIISWTTLAAVIGAGGLGGLILAGIGFNDKEMIFTGTLVAIILAVSIDLLFGKIEKRLST